MDPLKRVPSDRTDDPKRFFGGGVFDSQIQGVPAEASLDGHTLNQPGVAGTDPSSRRQALEGRVSELLREFKVSTSLWGTGPHKTFRALVDEVERGEAALDVYDGRLYRVASVVRVDVRYTCPHQGTSLQLYEAEQVFANGRCRIRGSDFAVWEKLRIGESPTLGVSRALHEELGIQGSIFVVPGDTITLHRPPIDFPGIPCRLTAHDYTACIRPAQFNEAGYEERQPDKTTFFRWRLAAAPPRTISSRRFTTLSIDKSIDKSTDNTSEPATAAPRNLSISDGRHPDSTSEH